MYGELLDFASESKRFRSGVFDFRSVKDPVKLEVLQCLFEIDRSLWIPTTVFFRYKYRKESKLPYSFESKEIEHLLPRFRIMVKKYLRSLKIKGIYTPSPLELPKAASSLYNDGGTARHDYELPQKSVQCGFKLQVFNPKPLQTREVWLPDKSTKINNLFWMIVGRQLLLKDTRYPDDDPLVTWSRIKDSLSSFGYFDVSAFGLQYPRELLQIVAEEITSLFPNPDISDQLGILKVLFSRVTLELENGKFVYPTRGIGLGYYEDLKTIGVLSILDQFGPISVYGDQGLLKESNARLAVDTLRKYGFIIKDNKFEFKQRIVKWAGWSMSVNEASRPKYYIEPLIAFLDGEYHWERKNMIRSYYEAYPELKWKISNYLPLFYELTYGFEFYKTDSFNNIENGGCSATFPFQGGVSKLYKAQRLTTPRASIVDNILYETPFFTEWKRADCKKHQLLRKKVFKTTPEIPSEIFEYSNPRIKLNKSRVVKYSTYQKAISDWYDLRLISLYGYSLGKCTSNLFGEELFKAILSCSRAHNPFEAYATGGYKVLTPWRGPPAVSSELCDLVRFLIHNVTRIEYHLTSRFDIDKFDISSFLERDINLKRKLAHSSVEKSSVELEEIQHEESVELQYNPVRFTENMILNLPEQRGDIVTDAVQVLSDLDHRFAETDVSHYHFGSEDDMDYLLDDFEEVDETFYFE